MRRGGIVTKCLWKGLELWLNFWSEEGEPVKKCSTILFQWMYVLEMSSVRVSQDGASRHFLVAASFRQICPGTPSSFFTLAEAVFWGLFTNKVLLRESKNGARKNLHQNMEQSNMAEVTEIINL